MSASPETSALNGATQPPPSLAGIEVRYPEKTFYLGHVFRDTTNSYKLVWFLAILSLLRRNSGDVLAVADIFSEMAVVAWHPVCLFRLSLGSQDKLQKVIQSLHQQSRLDLNAKPETIRKFLAASQDAKLQLAYFGRYVPTRFLAPWFADQLRGTQDSRRDAKITALAKASQRTPFASLYWFEGNTVRINLSWQCFLTENMAVIKAFAEHHLAIYLQARNPNVPGVINKLCAPSERQLNEARLFWRTVRAELVRQGRAKCFKDIYSGQTLNDTFSIDHFLPWSFVVHDLLWNLAPVELATNCSKNDTLPDIDLYLPRLSSLHFDAIATARKKPKLLEDYTDCFRLDASALLSLGQNRLEAKFREVIMPQAQIAINQGFQAGWRLRSQSVIQQAPSAESNIIELLPLEESASECLPFYSLEVAASGFLAGDAPEPEGWINVAKYGFSKRLTKGMFVTRVVGDSMLPTIKSGAYCIFRNPVEGTRQGRVVLVQKRNFKDPETGGSYTVKRYQSSKSVQGDEWQHQVIQLIPDNPNRKRFPILEFLASDDDDLQVIAEFIRMLAPTP